MPKLERAGSGLTLVWSKSDREEVQKFHAELWKKLRNTVKAEYKATTGIKWRGPIPGFKESVQSLLDQGYSLTDIGVMFGLTREMIRQRAKELGLKRHSRDGSMYRIWS